MDAGPPARRHAGVTRIAAGPAPSGCTSPRPWSGLAWGSCLQFPAGRRQHLSLGDSGASFIGFTLAGLAVMGKWAENDPIVALLTPGLILGVPLFDIAFVRVARVATGRVHSLHEWLAYTGRDHIHHREAVLVLLQAACVLAIIAVLEAVGRGRAA